MMLEYIFLDYGKYTMLISSNFSLPQFYKNFSISFLWCWLIKCWMRLSFLIGEYFLDDFDKILSLFSILDLLFEVQIWICTKLPLSKIYLVKIRYMLCYSFCDFFAHIYLSIPHVFPIGFQFNNVYLKGYLKDEN